MIYLIRRFALIVVSKEDWHGEMKENSTMGPVILVENIWYHYILQTKRFLSIIIPNGEVTNEMN